MSIAEINGIGSKSIEAYLWKMERTAKSILTDFPRRGDTKAISRIRIPRGVRWLFLFMRKPPWKGTRRRRHRRSSTNPRSNLLGFPQVEFSWSARGVPGLDDNRVFFFIDDSFALPIFLEWVFNSVEQYSLDKSLNASWISRSLAIYVIIGFWLIFAVFHVLKNLQSSSFFFSFAHTHIHTRTLSLSLSFIKF